MTEKRPSRISRPPHSRQPLPFRRARPSPLRRAMSAGALLAAAVLLVAVLNQSARNYTLARQVGRLERHKQDLMEQNARLREEIRLLETDDRYIERLARRELGLVRPGEIELLIIPPGGAPSHSGPGGAQGNPGEDTGGAGTAAPGPEPDAGESAERSRAMPPSWTNQVQEAIQGVIHRLFGWLHR